MQTTKPGEERRAPRPEEPPLAPAPARPRRPPKPEEGSADDDARIEDPVDEASEESMIASDPPARSGLRLGPAKRARRGS